MILVKFFMLFFCCCWAEVVACSLGMSTIRSETDLLLWNQNMQFLETKQE